MWWLAAILLLLFVATVSLDVHAYPNAESNAGHLRLTSDSGQTFSSVHLDTTVSATISGVVVTTDYVQRFRNNSDDWVEGVYVFPLPEMAAVQHMEMVIGDRRIVGEIKERKAAEKAYEVAKSEGKRTALTLQQRDNLFTQKVANIAPHQEVTVKLTFIDIVRFQNGLFEWRLPTTLTPRYIPGVSRPDSETGNVAQYSLKANPFGWAAPTSQVADADTITPWMVETQPGLRNPLHLNVQLQSGIELSAIEGLYHTLDIQKTQNSYQISFSERAVEMDRDVVLQWQPVTRNQPQAAIFQQALDGSEFAMVMMLPPNNASLHPLPKDIVFVIDVSGSMQGNSIVQAIASLNIAIDRLNPQDRFNIISFSNEFELFNSGLTYAGNEQKRIAQHWVSSLDADGGTEMFPALRAAYRQMDNNERLQQVVFITDGAIGNEEMLLDLITTTGQSARLFTVGIGSAPNTFFMTKAAQLGRGAYEFIASSMDVQSRMTTMLDKLNHVAATNINVNWPVGSEVYPEKSPDLFYGEALLSFAKLSQPLHSLTVSGDSAKRPWSSSITIDSPATKNGVGVLWARHKIAEIEDHGRIGLISQATVEQQVLSTALTHNLLTRFTAFIATEQSPVRPLTFPLSGQPVPNVMASAERERRLEFAQTSTSATFTFWLGLLGCAGLLITYRCARRVS